MPPVSSTPPRWNVASPIAAAHTLCKRKSPTRCRAGPKRWKAAGPLQPLLTAAPVGPRALGILLWAHRRIDEARFSLRRLSVPAIRVMRLVLGQTQGAHQGLIPSLTVKL